MTPHVEPPFGVSGLGWTLIVLAWLPLCAWLLVAIGRSLRGRRWKWLAFALVAARAPLRRPEILKIRGSRGVGVVGFLLLVLAALVVAVVLVVGFYEGRKAYWDYRVREMCERDGGVTILETVTISSDQAASLPRVGGVLGVAPEELSKPVEPVFARTRRTKLRERHPAIVRYDQDIVRRQDGRVIAKVVAYVRAGGDVPTYAFPSSFSCPDQTLVRDDISRVFRFERDAK